MVRVLQFTISETMGGRTQYLLNMWKHIDKEKIHFDFVTFSLDLNFLTGIDLYGAKVFRLEAYPEKDRSRFIQEFNRILDIGYDIVEIHTSYWKDTLVEQLAGSRHIKTIIHSHSTGVGATLSAEEMNRAIKRHDKVKKTLNEKSAYAFWACSEKAADWLFGANIPREKIEIVNNTIATDRFRYREDIRAEVRKELGLEGYFVIGHVGRLEAVKNQIFILRLFRKLRGQIRMKFLLVGDGSLENELKNEADALEISDDVIFMGRRRDTERLYQAMDYFLLPSHFEGFPIALLEAQCSGLKGICSSNISEEAVMTEDIKHISLEQPELWEQEILSASSGYKRNCNKDIIIRRGYDTDTEIRKRETRYEEIQSLADSV